MTNRLINSTLAALCLIGLALAIALLVGGTP